MRRPLFDASWLKQVRVLGLDALDEAELTALTSRVPFESLLALRLTFRDGKNPARGGLGDEVLPLLKSCESLALGNTTDAVVAALVAAGLPAQLEAGLATRTNPGDVLKEKRQAEAGFVWRYN